MKYLCLIILTISIFNLIKAFSNDDKCTIPNCEVCNKQISVESCYRCKEGYFVLRSYYGKKDECVKCDTIIPHCATCSYYIGLDCLACENGYELIKDKFHDDRCVPEKTFEDKLLLTKYLRNNN